MGAADGLHSDEGDAILLGRLAKSALQTGPGRRRFCAESRQSCCSSGRDAEPHVYREMRAIFNRLPKRELFYVPRASELKGDHRGVE